MSGLVKKTAAGVRTNAGSGMFAPSVVEKDIRNRNVKNDFPGIIEDWRVNCV